MFDVYSILLPRQHFVCFSHVAVGARLIARFVHCPLFDCLQKHRNESNTSGEGSNIKGRGQYYGVLWCTVVYCGVVWYTVVY